MKKGLKISLIVLAVLGLILYFMFRDLLDKIVFNVGLDSTTVAINNWQDVSNFLRGDGAVTFNFIIDVTNLNAYPIWVTDLETRVFYKGKFIGYSRASGRHLVGQAATAGTSAAKLTDTIDFKPGSYKAWIEPIDVTVEKSVIASIFTDLLALRDPELTYEVEMKAFGLFRYSYSDKVKVISTTLSAL